MKKIGQFLFNVVPLLLGIVLQFFAMIPVTGLFLLYALYHTNTEGNATSDDFAASLTELFSNSQYLGAVSIAFSALCILIFGYWYLKKYHTPRKERTHRQIHPFMIVSLIPLAIGLQYLINYLILFLSMLQPQWLSNYENLVESAGLDDMSGLMLIYGVFVAPIGEELLFRGVTMHHALRSMPFWAANILQALLFGAFHMNMIQGSYAFVCALFIGYVAYTSGGLVLPILMHMFFNFIGSYLPEVSTLFGHSVIGYCSAAVVAILITVYSLLLYQKGREHLQAPS